MANIKRVALAVAILGLASAAAAPASAQVIYQTQPLPYQVIPFPYSDPSPYDQTYGVRPSFQILPTPYGYAPAVRVTERCLYPNGWNVTDFDRDINGIPPGIDHQCPAPAGSYGRVRARY